MIEEILDELKARYNSDLLLDKDIEERERLEIIFKRELIAEIEEIVKGDI